MARPRTFNEQEVLDRAMDVFCRHGYDGSTMVELTSAMGLTAPSIYAAFGSKRGLFEAVLDRHAVCQGEHYAWIFSASTAREVVERMLLGAADQLIEASPGSLLVQAGLTAAPENADVPLALARRRRANEMALRDRFERAKTDGDLSARSDTAALAGFVMTVFDGLSVRAVGGAEAVELRQVAEQALASWQARSLVAEVVPLQPSALQEASASDGRGRRREFRASDALGAAMVVFWTKGYEGASLSDLTKAMGISRPSLYAAFGNKESLFLKTLDRYQQENLAYATKALEAPTARAMVEEMLAGAVAAQLSDFHPRGCLWVVNSMQGGDEATAIRAEVLRRGAEAHDLMLARLERAKAEGDLPSSSDPAGLAQLLGSVLQGIATLGAAGGTADQLRALGDALLALWPAG